MIPVRSDYRGAGWTDERIAALEKLWREGLSASQIAKQLGGVSRNAVIGKVHRMGWSGREVPSRPTRPQRAPVLAKTSLRTFNAFPSTKASAAPPPRPARGVAADIAFEALPGSSPKPLLALEVGHCRWPIGEAEPQLFCCEPQAEGRPYCAAHAATGVDKARTAKANANVKGVLRFADWTRGPAAGAGVRRRRDSSRDAA